VVVFFFFYNYDNIAVTAKYEELLAGGELTPIEQINQEYAKFRKRFSPDVLGSLDGEELIDTLFNVMNRDSLPYWLEFKNDDEFNNMFGSIAGGSALKYIIFKRRIDKNWITGSPQKQEILPIGAAVEKGRAIRDAMLRGADMISRIRSPDMSDYFALQEFLDNDSEFRLGSYGWIHKYYHMLFPDVIDTYHSTSWQKHYVLCMSQKPEADALYVLAGQIMREVRALSIPYMHAVSAMGRLFGPPVSYYHYGLAPPISAYYWNEMLYGGYISIGWNKLGNLRQYTDRSNSLTRANIQKAIERNYPDRDVPAGVAYELMRYLMNVKENDIISICDGSLVQGVGRIVGDYEYIEELEFPHTRKVEWLFTGLEELPDKKDAIRDAFTYYRDADNILKIRELAASGVMEIPEKPKPPAKPDVPLQPLSDEIKRIASILDRKKQVVLYGPPGTGKTYYADLTARELAARKRFKKAFGALSSDEKIVIVGDGRTVGLVRTCCFHPSYGYEDFIEGIKPRVENGATVFEMQDGVFKTLCKNAEKSPEQSFFMVIDEINRGDISRIFGELITLVESGKRGKSLSLPVSGELFCVPANVFIIGTMNTADRSIALLDIALRRRFGFRELMPDYELLAGVSFGALPLSEWLRQLNQRICKNLGKDARNLQIGHSYFMEGEKAITSQNHFRQVIAEDILPLIEEYCYGDYTVMAEVLGKSLIDERNQTLRYNLLSGDFADMVNALLQPCVDILNTDVDDSDLDQDFSDDASSEDSDQ